jgi:predicted nucleic acid-binding protein
MEKRKGFAVKIELVPEADGAFSMDISVKDGPEDDKRAERMVLDVLTLALASYVPERLVPEVREAVEKDWLIKDHPDGP